MWNNFWYNRFSRKYKKIIWDCRAYVVLTILWQNICICNITELIFGFHFLYYKTSLLLPWNAERERRSKLTNQECDNKLPSQGYCTSQRAVKHVHLPMVEGQLGGKTELADEESKTSVTSPTANLAWIHVSLNTEFAMRSNCLIAWDIAGVPEFSLFHRGVLY
jgi:hypothetical protein